MALEIPKAKLKSFVRHVVPGELSSVTPPTILSSSSRTVHHVVVMSSAGPC